MDSCKLVEKKQPSHLSLCIADTHLVKLTDDHAIKGSFPIKGHGSANQAVLLPWTMGNWWRFSRLISNGLEMRAAVIKLAQ